MNPFIETIVNGSSLATELTNISDALLLVCQTALFEPLNNYRQELSDKLVLEPLNFADDRVRCCYGRKGAIFENLPDTLFVSL